MLGKSKTLSTFQKINSTNRRFFITKTPQILFEKICGALLLNKVLCLKNFGVYLRYLSSHPKNSLFHTSEF